MEKEKKLGFLLLIMFVIGFFIGGGIFDLM